MLCFLVSFSRCFELSQFENAVHFIGLQAEKVLDRFFRFNKQVVTSVCSETHKKLQHCQEQARHKTVLWVTLWRHPVWLHKYLKMNPWRHRDKHLFFFCQLLGVAVHSAEETWKTRREFTACAHGSQVRISIDFYVTSWWRVTQDDVVFNSQLPRYVRLVDQLMLAHLVKLARHCVTEFVSKALEIGVAAPRDGFFKAKLVFSNEGATYFLTSDPFKCLFIAFPMFVCVSVQRVDWFWVREQRCSSLPSATPFNTFPQCSALRRKWWVERWWRKNRSFRKKTLWRMFRRPPSPWNRQKSGGTTVYFLKYLPKFGE